MARKKKHEEHANHEAWVLPYADFITLLLAFFVVMYSLSSINEGKYRVLAQSLAAAFKGTPRTFKPVQFGDHTALAPDHNVLKTTVNTHGGSQPIPHMQLPIHTPVVGNPPIRRVSQTRLEPAKQPSAVKPHGPLQTPGDIAGLNKIADEVEQAIAPLIKKHLVVVRRNKYWLEVEIKTDILFPSGVATLSRQALPILDKLAGILKPFPNPIRIEGYTDNVPIHTRAFPSNWELSAGRAASVARLLIGTGLDPHRLAIIGWGEYRPIADNTTAKGRNRNRRVTLVVLGASKVPARFYSDDKVAGNQQQDQLQGKANAHLGGS